MSGFFSQLRLDARVAFRGKLAHVTWGMALFFGLVLRFAIPAGAEHPPLHDAAVTATATGAAAPATHAVQTLRPPTPPPPMNGALLPLLFGLDTVILGLFFAGVMVLQEKMYGTVRVYRVTPSGALTYVASKMAVLTVLALSGAAVMMALVAPAGLLDGRLWLLLALATAALTLLGIGMSVFFANLSSFFYPLAGVGLVLSAPMVAYSLPSTALPAFTVLPTHAVMFGARELLFGGGRADVVGEALLVVAVALGVCGAFAALATRQRLMREVA